MKTKVTDKQLDDACRDACFKRDGYACVMCGKKCKESWTKPDGGTAYAGIQWSHVRSRRYKTTRWDMHNVKTLCAGCHKFKWHDSPAGFDPLAWFREKWPGRLEEIDAKLKRPSVKNMDREAVLKGLLEW